MTELKTLNITLSEIVLAYNAKKHQYSSAEWKNRKMTVTELNFLLMSRQLIDVMMNFASSMDNSNS